MNQQRQYEPYQQIATAAIRMILSYTGDIELFRKKKEECVDLSDDSMTGDVHVDECGVMSIIINGKTVYECSRTEGMLIMLCLAESFGKKFSMKLIKGLSDRKAEGS